MKLIPQKQVDRRLKTAYEFHPEFSNLMDIYFRESFPGLSVSHVMLYLYRRFGTIYGGDEKTSFRMWFDTGDMILCINGSYHEFVSFRLRYKSRKAAGSDMKPFFKERQARWRKRTRWLKERGLVDMWDTFDLSNDHPLMQFAGKLFNEGDYKDSHDFWHRQSDQVEAIRDQFPEEIKINMATSVSEFPIAEATAHNVVKEMFRTVYIRDVYLNILGYDQGDGQDDLSAAETFY